MDIVTLAAARKGSGGGASKEYVDEKVAALINDTTAAQNKAYSSAKVEEKVAGEEITTTATGTDLTLSTSSGNVNALTVFGKSEVANNEIVSAGDSGSIEVRTSGKNLFGGLPFATSLNAVSHASTIDTVNKTVTYNYRKQSSNQIIYECGFKPNTQYTVLLTGYTTNNNDSLLIKYTDGTDTHIAINAQLKTTVVTVSTANKTIKAIMLGYFAASLTTLYYDECGIFEGVKTASDFEPYNGTMAVFETGTPLRGIPNGAKDVAEWDGVSGVVTKNCDEANLANLTWGYSTQYSHPFFTGTLPTASQNVRPSILSSNYIEKLVFNDMVNTNKSYCIVNNSIRIRDDDYTTVSDFLASLGDAELVYELATPTTTPLTATENASIAALRTFEPQTHAQNNAGADMTVEAYAGTENGKAVADLKSALKITQSDTLTLTVAAWSNNAQVIAYAHDTAKRNVIDVDPSSVEEWANCGVLATSETASGITFSCKAVPTNALTFRVTSMGVN